MKKINKIYIFIIVLVIILIIFVTTNVLVNRVFNEKYLSQANSNSALLASQIKKGITIGGVTGTLEEIDTSDATALASDILLGETAYANGKKLIGEYEYDTSTLAQLKRSEKEVTQNTIVEDKYNNKIKIPAGFKIAKDSALVASEGVVIEDVSAGNDVSKGNQFVWIPLGELKSKNKTESIILGRYKFDSTTGVETLVQSYEQWSDTSDEFAIQDDYGFKYKELESNTNQTVCAKNLEQFITKATTSGGFYIGRYCLGDANAITTKHNFNSGITNPAVCKAGVCAYYAITQAQGATLCRNLYNNNNFESDLINSYAWDTTIVYIQKFSGNTTYSTFKGRQDGLEGIVCGQATDGYRNDKECNIYDLATICSTMSTETVINKTSGLSLRGVNPGARDASVTTNIAR